MAREVAIKKCSSSPITLEFVLREKMAFKWTWELENLMLNEIIKTCKYVWVCGDYKWAEKMSGWWGVFNVILFCLFDNWFKPTNE